MSFLLTYRYNHSNAPANCVEHEVTTAIREACNNWSVALQRLVKIIPCPSNLGYKPSINIGWINEQMMIERRRENDPVSPIPIAYCSARDRSILLCNEYKYGWNRKGFWNKLKLKLSLVIDPIHILTHELGHAICNCGYHNKDNESIMSLYRGNGGKITNDDILFMSKSIKEQQRNTSVG